MNKKLKHFMIYAAIVIFTLTCGFCAIWNFMYCKDMLVCIIIIGYFMTMLLFSDRIEKGLSWDPFLWSSLWIETFFVYNIPNEKKLYSELDGYSTGVDLDTYVIHRSNIPSDITSRYAEKRLDCLEKMNMVEYAAIEADPDLYPYILKAVTEELSFTYLKTKLNIPCGKDMYYDRFRRFFWLLDKLRK